MTDELKDIIAQICEHITVDGANLEAIRDLVTHTAWQNLIKLSMQRDLTRSGITRHMLDIGYTRDGTREFVPEVIKVIEAALFEHKRHEKRQLEHQKAAYADNPNFGMF